MNSINSVPIAAYLRTACSVLNFDIGELWLARKSEGQRPTLKFIQLYTSPTYQDFHSLLIRPEINSLKSDDEKHRISPIICQGVCDGGQIVWASTLILEGLIGRKELPLNTAVGMPICSIGDDLGIMVLFSVEQIAITPNSIEFLGCLSRAASENIAGFIAPSLTTPVSPANVEQFIGIWDIYELIKKYSSDISFHILPMAPLQSFFDYQETMTFRDLCSDMDTSVENMQEKESKKLHVADFTEFQQKSDTNSYDFSGPDLLIPGGKSFRMGFSKGASMNDAVFDDDNGPYFGNYLGSECSHDSQSNEKIYTIDSRDSYRKSPTRFHEFMIALLGMTIFDVAELWMMSERTQELHVVAALHRDGLMQKWTSVGRNLKLRRGEDIPGQVLETSQPFWDNRYDKKTMNDASKYPRSALAAEIGVKTALGIPLPGFKGTCGALTLYSRSEVDVEPLIANFVTKAIQLISAGSIESKTLSRIDIENLVYSPKNLVSDILNGKLSGPRIVFDEDSNPPFFYKVQMMGSLARPDPAPSMLSIKDASPRNYNSGKRKIHAPDENYWSNSLLEAAESYFTESTTTQHSRSSVEVNGNKDTKDMRKSKKVKVIISNDTESIVGPSTNETVHNADMKMKFDIPNVSRANVIDAEIPNNSSITSGTRRCQHEGCVKCAQGATKFCIAHGGGRRCTFPGCMKGARDKFFCAGHGGGKRCVISDCTKSAVGGSSMCTLHGGGKRCSYPGCSKSSQSSTNFCVKHGGGRKCTMPGCNKVSRGRTEFCASHGGGLRCAIEGCVKAAVGRYHLCKSHQESSDIDISSYLDIDDKQSIHSFPSSDDLIMDTRTTHKRTKS